jgi:hypothetical protein
MKFVATKTADQLDLQALHRDTPRADILGGRAVHGSGGTFPFHNRPFCELSSLATIGLDHFCRDEGRRERPLSCPNSAEPKQRSGDNDGRDIRSSTRSINETERRSFEGAKSRRLV